MYQRILSDPLNFPPDVSPDARSIMTGLLQRDPAQRLGANGAGDIRRHPFFAKHIDWHKLLARKIQPPFKPNVVRPSRHSLPSLRSYHPEQESVLDVANFDTEFTNEAPQDSVVEDSALSQTVQAQFEGFTYDPRNDHLAESVQQYGSLMR
jgi:serum/glucocorticoid-regulated kinase 2